MLFRVELEVSAPNRSPGWTWPRRGSEFGVRRESPAQSKYAGADRLKASLRVRPQSCRTCRESFRQTRPPGLRGTHATPLLRSHRVVKTTHFPECFHQTGTIPAARRRVE